MAMTPKRIAELRKAYHISGWQHGRHVTECLDEIERLQKTFGGLAGAGTSLAHQVNTQAEQIRRLREALMRAPIVDDDEADVINRLLDETEPK